MLAWGGLALLRIRGHSGRGTGLLGRLGDSSFHGARVEETSIA